SPAQTREVVLVRGGKTIATRMTLEASRNDIGVPGFSPETGVMVAVVQPGLPAEKAGLRRGDRIVSIDGVAMTTPARLVRTIQAAAGKPLAFTIERGGTTFQATIVPIEIDGRGRVGFQPDSVKVVRSYPLLEAMTESARENLKSAGLIFLTFKKLLKHELSLRAFSGPIEIYRISGQAMQEGLTQFLQLIALVSLQLGIINLFPIPPLDGGHVFTILIEGAIRRELSTQLKERAMQAGLILLLIFMATIIYFDITKSFFN
ncbi:MAG TPA: RIP metalloprotease RseP, partial [Candidatus Polarisedimenticolia bacterium]|nr:RIP metalloprotease RseP [Candidatus Polarisedimenticolia bacterium]